MNDFDMILMADALFMKYRTKSGENLRDSELFFGFGRPFHQPSRNKSYTRTAPTNRRWNSRTWGQLHDLLGNSVQEFIIRRRKRQ